jgi:apolipoprotein N-acyltransferase
MFKKKNKYCNYFTALLAGSLLPLSLSPFDYYLIIFPSLILLIYSINNTSIKQTFITGYFYGLGCFGFGVSWVYISIHEHGNASPLLAGFFTLSFIMTTLAFFPACKLVLYQYIQSKKPANKNLNLLILLPSIWVIFDWIQSWLFTGFPWLYVGYSQTNSPLASFAPIVSVFGLSWLVVFISSIIYLIIKNLKAFINNNNNQYCLNHILSYLVILVILFISSLSLSPIQWTKKQFDTEKIILIQGNIPQEDKWQNEQLQNHINKYLELTQPYWTDHSTIFWPESAVPIPLHYVNKLIDHIKILTQQSNSTLITGIPILAEPIKNNNKQYYNAMIAIDSMGYSNNKNFATYYKNKLVPWGEYVPFEKIFRGLINFFDLPMSNFIPGTANNLPYNILTSKNSSIRWLPFICYEIAYPDYVINHAKLGNAIVTISNDAWFGNSIGPWQHLQLARMRALETARPVVRSTNNGITAIINPNGKIIQQLPQFEANVLTDQISGYEGITPIMYYGVNFIIFICFIILLAALLQRTR